MLKIQITHSNGETKNLGTHQLRSQTIKQIKT